MKLFILLFVLLSSLGAFLRWKAGLLNPDILAGSGTDSLWRVVPWGTLAANFCGTAGLALASVFWLQRPLDLPPWLYTVLGTAFFGSLTTFSTFFLELAILLEQRLVLPALVYGLLSFTGGLVLALGGRALARAL